MPQHGVVRKKDWEIMETAPGGAVFRTVSDDETREAYPFEFDLRACFALEGKSLIVRYEVRNTGSGNMLFSIGSHPAFNMPYAGGSMENYYFHFSEEESIERHFFTDGMHTNETAPAFSNCRQISITRTLFDRGPLIFKQPASKDVTLMNSRNSKAVRVSTGGMPFLGLWAKPGAPFVCIEPWEGIPDNVDTDRNFAAKEGIMSLDAGGLYTTGYSIDILG
jgi:galactose mutarotase-like enzyme